MPAAILNMGNHLFKGVLSEEIRSPLCPHLHFIRVAFLKLYFKNLIHMYRIEGLDCHHHGGVPLII